VSRLTLAAMGCAALLAGCSGRAPAGAPDTSGPAATNAHGAVQETGPPVIDRYVLEAIPGLPDLAPEPAMGVRFSPDGKRYAYAHRRSPGAPPILHAGWVGKPPRSLDIVSTGPLWWSPDGERLAFSQELARGPGAQVSIKVVAVETGRLGSIRERVDASAPWIGFTSRGYLVLHRSDLAGPPIEAGLYHLDVSQGTERRLANLRGPEAAAYPSPDGTRVAYLAAEPGFALAQQLVVHDLATGQLRGLRRVPGDIGPLVWSPGSDALGYLTGVLGSFELHRVRLSDGADEVTPFYLGAPEVLTSADGTAIVGYSATGLSPDLGWCIVQRGGHGPLYAREMDTGKHFQLTAGLAYAGSWTLDSKVLFMCVPGDGPGQDRYYRVQVPR